MEPSSIAEARPAITELDYDSNLLLGLVGGGVAMLGGAILWGVITYFLEYQISWMAIGLGALVGFAVRWSGKGNSLGFGIIGAVLSLLGCVLGNYLFYIGVVAREWQVSFFEALLGLSLDPAAVIELFAITFDIRDLLFYGVAAYVGYQVARTKSKPSAGA